MEGQVKMQNTKRRQASEGHSLPVKCQGRDKVRILKETKQARGTHKLSNTEGWTHHYAKRNKESEGNSHPVKHRGWDNSGY